MKQETIFLSQSICICVYWIEKPYCLNFCLKIKSLLRLWRKYSCCVKVWKVWRILILKSILAITCYLCFSKTERKWRMWSNLYKVLTKFNQVLNCKRKSRILYFLMLLLTSLSEINPKQDFKSLKVSLNKPSMKNVVLYIRFIDFKTNNLTWMKLVNWKITSKS